MLHKRGRVSRSRETDRGGLLNYHAILSNDVGPYRNYAGIAHVGFLPEVMGSHHILVPGRLLRNTSNSCSHLSTWPRLPQRTHISQTVRLMRGSSRNRTRCLCIALFNPQIRVLQSRECPEFLQSLSGTFDSSFYNPICVSELPWGNTLAAQKLAQNPVQDPWGSMLLEARAIQDHGFQRCTPKVPFSEC